MDSWYIADAHCQLQCVVSSPSLWWNTKRISVEHLSKILKYCLKGNNDEDAKLHAIDLPSILAHRTSENLPYSYIANFGLTTKHFLDSFSDQDPWSSQTFAIGCSVACSFLRMYVTSWIFAGSFINTTNTGWYPMKKFLNTWWMFVYQNDVGLRTFSQTSIMSWHQHFVLEQI